MESRSYTTHPSSVIRADYCQGSLKYSHQSRGKQCMANCFLFFLHSRLKQLHKFEKSDLHVILDTGDTLYKMINNKEQMLLISDLPTHVHLQNNFISCKVQKTYAGVMVPGFRSDIGVSLENALNLAFSKSKQVLIVFHSSAVAIQSENGVFYVFDSHSRGHGSLCQVDGSCVLSILPAFSRLCDFLRSLCQSLSCSALSDVQFEVHGLNIKFPNTKPRKEVLELDNHYRNYLRIHSQSKAPQSEISGLLNKTILLNDNLFLDTNISQRRKRKHTTTDHSSKKKLCTKSISTGQVLVEENDYGNKLDLRNNLDVMKTKPDKSNRSSLNTQSPSKIVAGSKRSCLIANQHHIDKRTSGNVFTETSNKGEKLLFFLGQKVLEEIQKKQVQAFKDAVSDGPVFICTCCTQTWFKNGVIKVGTNKMLQNPFAKSCFLSIQSEGDCEWVCNTCYSNITQGKVPSCAIINGMGFPTKPPELDITEMEERLISPRIPFMQLSEKPRGGQRSLRGNVVNVPTDVQTTVKTLPRTLMDSETIQIKLKRKLSFKHSVMHESIRPNKCIGALKWLLSNSTVFQSEGIELNENWEVVGEDQWLGIGDDGGRTEESVSGNRSQAGIPDERVISIEPQVESIHSSDIKTDMNNIQAQPHSTATGKTVFHEPEVDSNFNREIKVREEKDGDIESDGWTEVRNNEDRILGNTDTILHPIDVRGMDKILCIAPGEGQSPLGLFQDKDSDYLSFPKIYCGQRRPENKERKTPVHYSTICKWELRCLDRRAACSIPNLFFKMKKLQIKQIQDKVGLAMRKCKTENKSVTVGNVLDTASFDNIVRQDEGYRVLRTLRGSPAYWEHAKKDIFAMIRQLGIPTWFCSFSAAETKWISLLKVLGKLLKQKCYTDDEINSLTWIEKSELIKSDPVTCARYFNQRVQVFISTILKGTSQPLGKIRDFFYRVEFQQRGSPHIHMLTWIENAPKYEQSEIEEVCSFIDKHTTCSKESNRPDLINYQTHRHARTCRKKGKDICRFGFPLLPMSRTRILQPFTDEELELQPHSGANYIIICQMLNDMTMGEDITFAQFLDKLEMTDEMYINAVRSSLTSPKIFLKRNPSEVRINSYNKMLLDSWEANIDVQFILDAYACASYIVSYISKGQRGMSNLLYEACEDVRKGNMDLRQQVRHIGNKFLTHVEVCAQEAAYLVLQMPLRMSSRTIEYINTSEPQNRTFLLKPMKLLEKMPQNSTNIESDNQMKRYQRRPKELQNCCLSDFVSMFDTVFPKKQQKYGEVSCEELPENEVECDEEINEDIDNNIDNQCDTSNFASDYHLKDGSVLKKRKTRKIIRCVRFSKIHDRENYFREQLMLYLPWRDEVKHLLGKFTSYELSYEFHLHTIQINKQRFEAAGTADVEVMEENIDVLTNSRVVAPGNQHNEEMDACEESIPSALYGCFDPGENPQSYDLALDLGITRKQVAADEPCVNQMSKKDYMKLTRSLNSKQLVFFYHVLHLFKTERLPLYCFLTGGAGVGKSVLTTALFQAVTRFFATRIEEHPDDVKAVLCAPTGKAAYNIGGSTIHSLFCIPANQSFKYKPLDSQQLDNMRVKFKNLKVIFIDEISMVGNRMLNYISSRLQDIFASQVPFGGISVVAIGDLYQLKPVMDGWIFDDIRVDYGPLATNLWKDLFHMFELDEIMRQKDDAEFAQILNRLREGMHTKDDVLKLQDQVLPEPETVKNKPHLFTTNAEVNAHNMMAYLNASQKSKCTISAIDTVSGDLSEDVKAKILEKVPDNPSKTMGLSKDVYIGENLPTEICVNVDVDDGLTNGTPGIVKKLDFRIEDSARCSIIWVFFQEQNIGAKTRMKYSHLYKPGIDPCWTPVLEMTRKFSVGRSQACVVTRRQFPVRLASAKTIHKSQGSTMETAVLHFGTRKQEHMHYVGLSRVRKLHDVHILKLNETKIEVSADVVNEMDRLRMHASMQSCIPILSDIDTDLKIVYHNSRSLHLHIKDLLADVNLLSADIIAIAESRLQSSDPDQEYILPGFTMYRADSKQTHENRPYQGIVIYSKLHLNSLESCVISGVEFFSVTFAHSEKIIKLVTMYNPPKNASATNFISFMKHVFQAESLETPVIIMGDTNMDSIALPLKVTSYLQKHGISQIMHSITTDYGTCLDHIYTRCLSQEQISCATLESYYSDHKPIVAYLPLHNFNSDRTKES